MPEEIPIPGGGVLRVWTGKELFESEPEPEVPEHAYRRGYRDGWVVAVQELHHISERVKSLSVAYDAVWTHWERGLLRWTHEEDPKIIMPPAIPREVLEAAIERHRREAAHAPSSQRVKLAPRVRFTVLRRDGYRCQLCGLRASDGAVLEVDHKVPVSRGGSNRQSNLWTLCWDCNRGKSASTVTENDVA